MLNFRLPERLFEPLQVVDGPLSRGIVQTAAPGVLNRPKDDFKPPRLTCRVAPHSVLRSGMVVTRRSGGTAYLLVDAGADNRQSRNYWMVPATHRVAWEKKTTSIEPITGLPTAGAYAAPVSVWMVWEPMGEEGAAIGGVRNERVRVMTGADVQAGDKIDGQMVKRVQQLLGVRLITVE